MEHCTSCNEPKQDPKTQLKFGICASCRFTEVWWERRRETHAGLVKQGWKCASCGNTTNRSRSRVREEGVVCGKCAKQSQVLTE